MDTISFADFQKIDIRIAKIVKAEEVEGADKLVKLTLDVGELGERTIAAGIKEWYPLESLEGRSIVYLANLEPKNLRGIESQGMLLAAGAEEAVLIIPEKEVAPGTKIR